MGGFTLVETIGVLVIISILAAALMIMVMKRVDQAAASRESTDLNVISEAFVQSSIRNKVIPGTNTWATAVAQHTALPLNRIMTTPRGFARAFLIDPNLSIGGSGLPYTQTSAGTNKPVSARVMFVSSMARSALPVATGIPSTAEFNAIWDTPEGGKPATVTWTSWASGEDLKIKKVSLEPLFHRLILVDRDPSEQARFSVDGTNILSVPTNALGWSSYYMDGSVLGLHGSNSVVSTRHLLKQDISFVFEHRAWRGQLAGRIYGNATAAEFEREAEEFFAAAWNPDAHHGSSQQTVLVAMYTFMFSYTLWANECPRFSRHDQTSSLTEIPEYRLINEIGRMNGFLDQFSDESTGLLKP